MSTRSGDVQLFILFSHGETVTEKDYIKLREIYIIGLNIQVYIKKYVKQSKSNCTY